MEEGEGEREERASIWAEVQGQITIQDDSDGEAGGGGEEEEEEEEAPEQSKLTKARGGLAKGPARHRRWFGTRVRL